jgi:hypothetical protein
MGANSSFFPIEVIVGSHHSLKVCRREIEKREGTKNKKSDLQKQATLCE